MILYRYALDAEGHLADAPELVGTPGGLAYACIACGRAMAARVNGKQQRPHFAHKAAGECGKETYLHLLAKTAFAETYRRNVADGEPYNITITAPRRCDRLTPWLPAGCKVGKTTQTYDLTAYYREVRVEKRHGEFVPDVSLHSAEHPNRDPVFVEIAVNHFLSEKKERSGGRIIEIPVEAEEDVEPIRGGNLDENVAKFIGFAPEVASVPDADCVCGRDRVLLFVVYGGGKCHMRDGELRELHDVVFRKKLSIAWYNLIPLRDAEDADGPVIDCARGRTFVRQVRQAAAEGAPVRSCYLCDHADRSRAGRGDRPIYCSLHRRPCGSNAAANCDQYAPSGVTSGGGVTH